MKRDELLNQYFTPVWAAEQIIARYYPNLTKADVVFDVGCGDGRFLMSLPGHVAAYGFELDSALAQQARINSNRPVFEGCFTETPFPEKPTVCIGNPPYDMGLVNGFLSRAYETMDYGGKCGFILPVYFFQTADTVIEYMRSWSLSYDLLPRNMFEGMSKPVMFAQFLKERTAASVGFFLYDETSEIQKLKKKYRVMFMGNESSTHLWGSVIDKALAALGGQASLQDIYLEIEGVRPTSTKHWKAQIRKVLQQFYQRVGDAIWSFHPAANPVPTEQQLVLSF